MVLSLHMNTKELFLLLERWYRERPRNYKKDPKENKQQRKSIWDKRQLVKKINLNSLYGAIQPVDSLINVLDNQLH